MREVLRGIYPTHLSGCDETSHIPKSDGITSVMWRKHHGLVIITEISGSVKWHILSRCSWTRLPSAPTVKAGAPPSAAGRYHSRRSRCPMDPQNQHLQLLWKLRMLNPNPGPDPWTSPPNPGPDPRTPQSDPWSLFAWYHQFDLFFDIFKQ